MTDTNGNGSAWSWLPKKTVLAILALAFMLIGVLARGQWAGVSSSVEEQGKRIAELEKCRITLESADKVQAERYQEIIRKLERIEERLDARRAMK